jgi:hypothetical protein
MKPLAQHLGVKRVVANRLEFRDGTATGRLLEPVIRPRGAFARIREQSPDGRTGAEDAGAATGYYAGGTAGGGDWAGRESTALERPIVHFEGQRQQAGFSVRRALAGKHVMLIGVTGFIGKVWLANTLMELPKIGRIYLLIRRQKSNPATAAV